MINFRKLIHWDRAEDEIDKDLSQQFGDICLSFEAVSVLSLVVGIFFNYTTEHKNETERIFRLSFIFVKIWIKFLSMVNCFFCYVSHCVCVNAKLRQN